MVELRNISKKYPGKNEKANNNITLDIRKGEILCIAGENGAGKTTLMKILCGLENPDEGEIFINGKKEIIASPNTAKELGIGMVHQHFMLFPDYTAAENIVMGIEPRKWKFFFDKKKANNDAQKIIDDNNFPVKSTLKVKDLSLGEMQQVEICRILYHNAQVIILDEPTSILTGQETQSLFKTLKSLVSKGKSIVLITHKLSEIKNICDRVAVLRRGKLSAVRSSADIDEYEIARLMFNEDTPFKTSIMPKEKRSFIQETVISFENVTVRRKNQKRPLLDDVSFSVNNGEILGITGVGGNGLGIIEAVLGGFLHPASGKVLHKKNDISGFNIRALRNQGLAIVPADRLRFGSAKDAKIEENMIINRRRELFKNQQSRNTWRGINPLNIKKIINEFSDNLIEKYKIKGAKTGENASVLSGGNLQKLILAREINWLKDYIVFSQPSWGLDFASSCFIMNEIISLRNKGAAVILISTNPDEILAMADRVIVMYKGKTAGEFINNGDVSVKEAVINRMQGILVQN